MTIEAVAGKIRTYFTDENAGEINIDNECLGIKEYDDLYMDGNTPKTLYHVVIDEYLKSKLDGRDKIFVSLIDKLKDKKFDINYSNNENNFFSPLIYAFKIKKSYDKECVTNFEDEESITNPEDEEFVTNFKDKEFVTSILQKNGAILYRDLIFAQNKNFPNITKDIPAFDKQAACDYITTIGWIWDHINEHYLEQERVPNNDIKAKEAEKICQIKLNKAREIIKEHYSLEIDDFPEINEITSLNIVSVVGKKFSKKRNELMNDQSLSEQEAIDQVAEEIYNIVNPQKETSPREQNPEKIGNQSTSDDIPSRAVDRINKSSEQNLGI